ncbi:MAG: hypothetical protein EZS28_043067, partial [Streblomastix strix]
QSQLSVTPTQKSQHRSVIRQRLKKAERELEQLQANQQLQQQENNDLNNTNIETLDIQGTVGQLTGLQPSSGAQNAGLNVGPRLKEAGSISANNRKRTEPQINEGYEDNAEEEEYEQTDEAALNQNKVYRVNIISLPLIQENLGTQPQNNQGLNALSQIEKDNSGPAAVGVQEKPKKGKGSKKSKTEGLKASDEPSQGSNAQSQTKPISKVPKPKRSIAPDRAGTLQSGEISVEISLWNREEERTGDSGSSRDGGNDWRIDLQKEGQRNGRQEQMIYRNMKADRERRLRNYWILFEI